jgi:DNA-binding beta-propeller fold protein YncE/mono/diheme cytochrome c family protein
MKMFRWLPLGAAASWLAAGALAGCGDDDTNPGATPDAGADVVTPPPGEGGVDGGPVVVAKGTSRDSSVALSADESRLVVCNRDKGSVTVFGVVYAANTPPALTKVAEVDLGASSEPWSVAIAPDGRSALVVLREAQKLVKITGLDGTPTKGAEVAVGSEPTAVALTPTGAQAWVTNWVDGTISVVTTADMKVARTVDLNAAIAPALGAPAGRPALAHPRALAITNNGDANDGDETVWVAEYFAAQKDPLAADGANADTAREGVVYKVNVSDGAASLVKLAPIAEMGPVAGTACFPNQLQSLTLNGKYAYVVSVCASPRGPVNAQANTASAVSVIDTAAGAEVAAASASLSKRWHDRYEAASPAIAADSPARRLPSFANALAFVPGGDIAYLTANGADALFRLGYDGATGAIKEVGSTAADFINLRPQGIAPEKAGSLPTGVTIGSKGFAFVANDVTRNVSVVDLAIQRIAGTASDVSGAVVASSAALPAGGSTEEKVLKGRRFFNTGLGRWSLNGQGWGACQSCHGDGLTDNVTWFFARGPRQSTSLEGSFSKGAGPVKQRIFNWTAIFDEVADFEANTRGVAGGVGAIVSTNSAPPVNGDRIDPATADGNGSHGFGLNGSVTDLANPANPLGLAAPSLLSDWAEIEEYIKSIRAPKRPTNLDAAKVTAGKALFQQGNCQGCHGGALWTVAELFYTRSLATNGALDGRTFDMTALPATVRPNDGQTDGQMRQGTGTGNDSLVCALRNVGTFGTSEAAVAAGGAYPELRADMTTPAQGGAATGRGFSPPSLLGVQVGGPYLHAGNARTLEALLSDTFQAHHRALSANFLTGGNAAVEREQLIHFLLSIDASEAVIAPPAAGATGGVFCSSP